MKVYNVNGTKVFLKSFNLGGDNCLLARHNALSALGFSVIGWL